MLHLAILGLLLMIVLLVIYLVACQVWPAQPFHETQTALAPVEYPTDPAVVARIVARPSDKPGRLKLRARLAERGLQ